MTLSDLLATQTDVQETADGYLIHCPAHADTRQSLRLAVSDTGKILVRCRAGCPTDKVIDGLGITMRDLARMTAGDAVPSHPATSQDAPAGPAEIAALATRLDRYHGALIAALTIGEPGDQEREVFHYGVNRFGLTRDDFVRLGLGAASDLPGGPRLVVPFRDKDGVARGFQARALEKDAQVRWYGPKSPEGASWAKVGWFPGGSGWDEILVCEGPGDALTGAALGYDTIGIRGAGLASNPSVVDTVAEMIGDREAVVAGDGDPAGRRFSATLAEALASRDVRVRILDLPDGLDLTDLRAQDSSKFAREVVRAVAQAEPVVSRGAALLAWDEDRYSLTDLGAARYLRDYIESIGSGVRYTPEAGFLLLDDGVWRIDDRQAVRTHAQTVADIVRRLAHDAAVIASANGATDQERKRAGRMKSYAAHAQTSRGLDAMLRELQAVQGVPASINDFDKHVDLLACRNGVIDLRTGELLPHDPLRYISRRIDVDYDPNAKAPRWEQFLKETFPDEPQMPGYLQRLIGYGVTGRTDEEIFVVHLGKGSNGKSKFLEALTETFREITTTTPFSTFEAKSSGGIPNDLAALKGARLVMASEGEQGKRMAEAVLKRVTGGDLISARFMRQEFFEFRPQFLLHLATNAEPNFRGQDEGLWRRVKLIRWKRYFAVHERDKRLSAKLLAEKAGILAWAVRGAKVWYERGLEDPDVVEKATQEYRATSNVLDGFLPGKYLFDDDSKAVLGSTLFHDFQTWADEENHLDLKRWSQRAFYGALGERGLNKRVGSGNKTVFDGIRRAKPSDTQKERAEETPLALSSTDSDSPLSGADLDDVI